MELPQDQKDDLTNWLSTNYGNKAKKAFLSSKKKTNSGTTGESKNKRKSDGNAGSNWKKRMRKSLKSDKGLKSVMEILAEAETSNQSFASALSTVSLPSVSATLPIPPPGQVASVQQKLPSPFISKSLPATSIKLQSILKRTRASCAKGSGYVQAAQIAATIATITARDAGDNYDPRTELDSHADMIVLGAHAFIFDSTNRTCNFQPFDPSLGTASKIPIVDGAVVYEYPYTGEIYVLILRNALHIPHL